MKQLERLSRYRQLSNERLPELESHLVRLLVPDSVQLDRALATLREVLPDAAVDYNHSYEVTQTDSATASREPAILAAQRYRPANIGNATQYAVGMIDSGVEIKHLALRQSRIQTRSFLAGNRRADASHGTAVASLLVGQSPDMLGIVPSVRLFAAEVFFRDDDFGLIATGHSLVQSLSWLMGNGVRVVNLSLAGPDNRVLQRALELARGKDVYIVAAAGNNGPASPPRFPAAYESVFAATAVDSQNRPYLRAGRGDHLDYAAPGVDLLVADGETVDGYQRATGTSYATPFVTGLVIHHLSQSREGDIQQRLDGDVIDLGEPGPDPIFGRGLIGASLLEEATGEEGG